MTAGSNGMTLDVSQALREGLQRTATRAGATLAGAFLLIAVVGNVGIDSATVSLYELAVELDPGAVDQPLPPEATPFALPLSGSMILLVLLVWLLAWTAIGVIAVRVMAAEPDDDHGQTADGLSRRLAAATANELIARIMISILLVIGFLLLVIPGVLLAIGLYLVRPLIAVEDRNFADAMVESWRRTRGNRFEVFVLLIGAVVLYVLMVIPGLLASLALGSVPVAATVVYQAVGAVAMVFWLAVVARAHVQLVPGETSGDGSSSAPADADEWNDPPGVEW